ncbi:hypothetical protein PLESTF_001752800 [Pleodorina starrii]|nr:hypothetical protein PLESTF_001752800 [Pleodorina starrii]
MRKEEAREFGQPRYGAPIAAAVGRGGAAARRPPTHPVTARIPSSASGSQGPSGTNSRPYWQPLKLGGVIYDELYVNGKPRARPSLLPALRGTLAGDHAAAHDSMYKLCQTMVQLHGRFQDRDVEDIAMLRHLIRQGDKGRVENFMVANKRNRDWMHYMGEMEECIQCPACGEALDTKVTTYTGEHSPHVNLICPECDYKMTASMFTRMAHAAKDFALGQPGLLQPEVADLLRAAPPPAPPSGHRGSGGAHGNPRQPPSAAAGVDRRGNVGGGRARSPSVSGQRRSRSSSPAADDQGPGGDGEIVGGRGRDAAASGRRRSRSRAAAEGERLSMSELQRRVGMYRAEAAKQLKVCAVKKAELFTTQRNIVEFLAGADSDEVRAEIEANGEHAVRKLQNEIRDAENAYEVARSTQELHADMVANEQQRQTFRRRSVLEYDDDDWPGGGDDEDAPDSSGAGGAEGGSTRTGVASGSVMGTPGGAAGSYTRAGAADFGSGAGVRTPGSGSAFGDVSGSPLSGDAASGGTGKGQLDRRASDSGLDRRRPPKARRYSSSDKTLAEWESTLRSELLVCKELMQSGEIPPSVRTAERMCISARVQADGDMSGPRIPLPPPNYGMAGASAASAAAAAMPLGAGTAMPTPLSGAGIGLGPAAAAAAATPLGAGAAMPAPLSGAGIGLGPAAAAAAATPLGAGAAMPTPLSGAGIGLGPAAAAAAATPRGAGAAMPAPLSGAGIGLGPAAAAAAATPLGAGAAMPAPLSGAGIGLGPAAAAAAATPLGAGAAMPAPLSGAGIGLGPAAAAAAATPLGVDVYEFPYDDFDPDAFFDEGPHGSPMRE